MSGSRTAIGNPGAERELVFCHQCENEWYREGGNGLSCPRCGSEFAEVIDPDFDPRADFVEPHPLSSHNPWAASDPDEDDIDNLQRGASGALPNYWSDPAARNDQPTIFRRPTGQGPTPPGFPTSEFGNLASMLQSMTGQRQPPMDPYGMPGFGAGQFQGQTGSRSQSTPPLVQQPGNRRPRVEVFTTSGPGFTFTTRTSTQTFGGPAGGQEMGYDDLNMVVERLFRNLGVPGQMGRGPRGEAGPPTNPLAAIFSTLLNPANAAHGDAVFSQEAFDRVMSQLMEEHVSGNAPGPASAAAIQALPRKKVDESMLDEKTKQAECSICMDNVAVGEEVTTLPCGHWFHHPCVEAWLKEHDTCPVCRSGITPAEGSRHTARSPNEAPLHDQDPFVLARQESGTREHPFVIPESPTRERRRRPSSRRHSSSEQHSTTRRRSGDNNSGGGGGSGGGTFDRVRSFFGRG